MKKNNLWILASLAVLVFVSFIVKDLMPAAVSNVNVFVTGEIPAGGSYNPPLPPTLPPSDDKEQPQVKEEEKEQQGQLPPEPEQLPDEQQRQPEKPESGQDTARQGEPKEQEKTPLAPAGLSNAIKRIPQILDLFSKLGINDSTSAASLKNYNLFLPSLSQITGAKDGSLQLPNLNSEQISKMPEGVIFILMGNGKINFPLRLDFTPGQPITGKIKALSGKEATILLKAGPGAVKASCYFAKIKNISADENSFSIFPKVKAQESQDVPFEYQNSGQGVFVAKINFPSSPGQYELVSSITYQNSEQQDIGVNTLVDPLGYIYQAVGGRELRISNAVVSLYQKKGSEYVLWPAHEFGQDNPQTTDKTGTYAFLVPEGQYYVAVQAPGYFEYKSDAFEVKRGKEITGNIALVKKFDLPALFNFNNIALAVLFCMVIYNFYNDRRREKIAVKKNGQES